MGSLNCNSKKVVYLFDCDICTAKSPHTGNTKNKFRLRVNNYNRAHTKKNRKKYFEKGESIVIKKEELKQRMFHLYHCSENHLGIENWRLTIIDKVEQELQLRRKDLYWTNTAVSQNNNILQQNVA